MLLLTHNKPNDAIHNKKEWNISNYLSLPNEIFMETTDLTEI